MVSDPFGSIPPGDQDPNQIYIAVGKAIHRWECLEQELAALYLKFAGKPYEPEHFFAYGKENGTFVRRMTALTEAAEKYFVRHHDQRKEGEFQDLARRTHDLSITRHRIAHGRIVMGAAIPMPQEKGVHTVEVALLYRWAPPFYGQEKLRTNFIGDNAAQIEATGLQFEALNNEVVSFAESL